MEVLGFSVSGFKTPPVEFSGPALHQALLGPNDERKASLLQGLRLLHELIGCGWPPIHGIAPLGLQPQVLNSDGQTPIDLLVEFTSTVADYEAAGAKPTTLNLGRLRVGYRVVFGHWTSGSGYTVTTLVLGDGVDVLTSGPATLPPADVNLARNLIMKALVWLHESLKSPAADAWPDGEGPELNADEQLVLDRVATFRLEKQGAMPEEHLAWTLSDELGDRIAQAVAGLVSKRCLERVQGAGEPALELSATGLLACPIGGEAAGLAMCVLRMQQRRARTEGKGFRYFTQYDVSPFDFRKTVSRPGAFPPIASTAIELLRLAQPGTQAPWYVHEMGSLLKVRSLRDLRARAEQLRAQDAEAAARRMAEQQAAASEMAAFLQAQNQTTASATTGGTAISAAGNVIVIGTVGNRGASMRRTAKKATTPEGSGASKTRTTKATKAAPAATVKTSKTEKTVSARSGGGQSIAAGRDARVDGIGERGAVAAGDDAVVRFAAAMPSELASEARALLADLRKHAEAVTSPPERKEAKAALVHVETQLAKPKPNLQRTKSYLAVFASFAVAASKTVAAMVDVLDRVAPFFH